MKIRLSRLVFCICFFSIYQISFVNAGLNRFTQIDSFGKWIIEQKFDSDRKEVFCRASMTGYGTWFGEKIRLGMNDEIIFPTDDSKKIVPNLTQIEIVRKLLDKCRAGLLYLPN